QPTADDLSFFFQRFINRFGHVSRDGEADALKSPAFGSDGGVDANDLSLQIDKRAAAIARVDRCVGLDEILVAGGPEDSGLAVERANDAVGHRADVAEGAAKGEDPVTLLQARSVAPRGRFEAARLDLDDSKISRGVGADELGALDNATVGECDLH